MNMNMYIYIYIIYLQSNTRLSTEDSFRADAWALQKIATYQHGKVLLWSWVSRGLVDMEQVARWYYNGDIAAAEKALSATPGAMAELCAVDEVPQVDVTTEREQVEAAQGTLLDGETSSVWAISDCGNNAADPITLPMWFNQPIQKTILLWKKESSSLEEGI